MHVIPARIIVPWSISATIKFFNEPDEKTNAKDDVHFYLIIDKFAIIHRGWITTIFTLVSDDDLYERKAFYKVKVVFIHPLHFTIHILLNIVHTKDETILFMKFL